MNDRRKAEQADEDEAVRIRVFTAILVVCMFLWFAVMWQATR